MQHSHAELSILLDNFKNSISILPIPKSKTLASCCLAARTISETTELIGHPLARLQPTDFPGSWLSPAACSRNALCCRDLSPPCPQPSPCAGCSLAPCPGPGGWGKERWERAGCSLAMLHQGCRQEAALLLPWTQGERVPPPAPSLLPQ